MKPIRLSVLLSLAGLVGLWAAPAAAQTVHAGADTDTQIRIGYPDYQHEVLHDSHTGWLYTEANAHSWLPNPQIKASEAEAHASRFHLDNPWPIPDIQWTNCWVRTVLRDGYNPKSAGAKASAWGSVFIVDGPPGEMAEVRAHIPRQGSVLYDLPPSEVPSQGMYADSFFDILTEVTMAVVDPAVGVTDLIRIRNTLGGSASPTPGLVFTEGDWVRPYMAEEDVLMPDGSIRKRAYFRDDVFSPTTVWLPTNTPFEVHWLVNVEIPTVLVEDELTYCVGGACALAVQLELVDGGEGRYNLRAVPEPATMGLLALGGVALIRRRRGA
jgi:hypothetical protein